MKKFALLFSMLVMFAIANSANAQSGYKSAIGLRLGYPIAASYKFFISDPAAIELYAGFRGNTFYSWIHLGAMYQYHFPISSVEGLQWYVGGGASALLYSFDNGFATGEGTFGIGINGALGLDYKFANAPINLSVDWLPTIFISGYVSGFGGGYGALAARYTLN